MHPLTRSILERRQRIKQIRILVVEDEADISALLRDYLSENYTVEVTASGRQALAACLERTPDLILLDMTLPDIDSFNLLYTLRNTDNVSDIPIFFLGQSEATREQRLAALELEVHDFVTKPFDIVELGLRIKNVVLPTTNSLNEMDTVTGLPSGVIVEQELSALLDKPEWTVVLVSLNHLEPFRDMYGLLAGFEALRLLAMKLNAMASAFDTVIGGYDTFVGYAQNEHYLLMTPTTKNMALIVDQFRKRFNAEVQALYSAEDLEQNGLKLLDGRIVPLISVAYGVVTNQTKRFQDIAEIIETADIQRRLDTEEE